MLDLNVFPLKLDIFGAESAWQIKENIAIVLDAKESDIDKAEIILNLNSYEKKDIPEERLEKFYISGDYKFLQEEYIPGIHFEPQTIYKDMIIPSSIIPTKIHIQYINKIEQEIKNFYLNFYINKNSDIMNNIYKWHNYISEHWIKFYPLLQITIKNHLNIPSNKLVKKFIYEVNGLDSNIMLSILDELKGIIDINKFEKKEIKKLPDKIPIKIKINNLIQHNIIENTLLKSHFKSIICQLNIIKKILNNWNKLLKINLIEKNVTITNIDKIIQHNTNTIHRTDNLLSEIEYFVRSSTYPINI